jgi:hypothetical protein
MDPPGSGKPVGRAGDFHSIRNFIGPEVFDPDATADVARVPGAAQPRRRCGRPGILCAVEFAGLTANRRHPYF